MRLPKALQNELKRLAGAKPPAVKNPVLKLPKLPSVNERTFRWLWQQFSQGAEGPVYEHRFADDRAWRFDCAWPEQWLAVEIEGGSRGVRKSGKRVAGRHQASEGYQRDIAKYNRAVALGWRVLRYTDRDLQERPQQVIEEILISLGDRS